MLELSKLAKKKDPVVYKYLQEHDHDLLEFNIDDDVEDEDTYDGVGQPVSPPCLGGKCTVDLAKVSP